MLTSIELKTYQDIVITLNVRDGRAAAVEGLAMRLFRDWVSDNLLRLDVINHFLYTLFSSLVNKKHNSKIASENRKALCEPLYKPVLPTVDIDGLLARPTPKC